MRYLIIFLALVVYSTNLFAFVPPAIQWKILETEHFEIIYDSQQADLAREYALQTERSYQLLIPIFKESPKKTLLVILDQTDMTNGSATGFPRPTINTFPVLPTSLDSIGHYDNWSQNLVIHEYAHILNMEPAHGIWAPFRFVFGSIIKPNILLPRWYLEGLAVEIETRYTKMGRLRSSLHSAMVRAMIEGGTWRNETIDRINESTIPTWPMGNRPYFYGSLLMSELGQKKGPEVYGELNERYSRRFPFFINAPVEEKYGSNYAGLFEDLKIRYETFYKQQIEFIKGGSKPLVKEMGTKNITEHSPAISPDGKKIAFVSNNPDGDSELRVAERSDTKSEFAFENSKLLDSGERILKATWSADSSSVIFDKVDEHRLYYLYSDLYRQNVAEKKIHTLNSRFKATRTLHKPLW